MRKARALAVFLLSLASWLPGAHSQTFTPSDRIFDNVSLYWGRGVDLNLQEIPGAIFSGDWNEEPSYFWGLGVGKTLNTLGGSFQAARDTPFADIKHGYEVIYLQHRGRQTNSELSAAYLLRTPDLELSALRVNFAAGAGLSHAFGTPTYEDGPVNDPSRRYRTQFLMLFEFEWGLASVPALTLVTRIHHRSGIFGVIAPRRVGSNFSVVGLRYRF
jgi:hypothetical protein